nr:LysR family transcriptional regulator substrate-binding protein [Pseudobdellovibrionaceae bacterium]
QQKKFILTREGESLYQRCHSIFESLHSMIENSSQTVSIHQSPIRLGTSLSLGKHILSSHLESYRNIHSDAHFNLQFGTSLEIADQVAQNKIDLGLILVERPLPGLKSRKLRSGYFICAEGVGAGAEVDNKEKTNLKTNLKLKEDSLEKGYYLTEERPETESFITNFTKQYGHTPRIIDRISSWDYISFLTEQGYGRGVLPDFMVCHRNKFKIVHEKFKHPYQIILIYRHLKSIPAGAHSFYKHLFSE